MTVDEVCPRAASSQRETDFNQVQFTSISFNFKILIMEFRHVYLSRPHAYLKITWHTHEETSYVSVTVF